MSAAFDLPEFLPVLLQIRARAATLAAAARHTDTLANLGHSIRYFLHRSEPVELSQLAAATGEDSDQRQVLGRSCETIILCQLPRELPRI